MSNLSCKSSSPSSLRGRRRKGSNLDSAAQAILNQAKHITYNE